MGKSSYVATTLAVGLAIAVISLAAQAVLADDAADGEKTYKPTRIYPLDVRR